MMGIPVDEPVYVFGDNQSVLAITSAPVLTLIKAVPKMNGGQRM